jgi:hypothetical protein
VKFDLWVAPWVPWPSSRCARDGCKKLRLETKSGVRRYCEKHSNEYDKEANAISENKKLLRPGCFVQRPGVSRSAKD